MTSEELLKVLEFYKKTKPDRSLRVVIDTKNGGIPTSFKVDVIKAQAGFDWTNGMLILMPEDPIVVFKELKGKTYQQLAKERLDSIKESYGKVGQKYIPKAREGEWIEGFMEGLRMFAKVIETQEPPSVESFEVDKLKRELVVWKPTICPSCNSRTDDHFTACSNALHLTTDEVIEHLAQRCEIAEKNEFDLQGKLKETETYIEELAMQRVDSARAILRSDNNILRAKVKELQAELEKTQETVRALAPIYGLSKMEAMAVEREACAEIAEDFTQWASTGTIGPNILIAERIRARASDLGGNEYPALCRFIPPTKGYAPCKRVRGHDGPCAHDLL